MATFREWMSETLDPEDMRTLVVHGASAGIPGLIYYSDTSALYDRFADEIWAAMWRDAEAFGYPNTMAYLASVASGPNVCMEDEATFRNAMVWLMAERTAMDLYDPMLCGR